MKKNPIDETFDAIFVLFTTSKVLFQFFLIISYLSIVGGISINIWGIIYYKYEQENGYSNKEGLIISFSGIVLTIISIVVLNYLKKKLKSMQ